MSFSVLVGRKIGLFASECRGGNENLGGLVGPGVC